VKVQLFEKLIEYPEAERLVFESTPRLPVEETPLGEALGLALAWDLTATTDSPPFHNSAVDGYALRSEDAEAGRVFGVVDEAPAGRPAKRRVAEGEAIKIFTGGVIPDGADAVVMVENTSGWGEEFELKKAPSPGDNIRAAGEDTRKGDVILAAGTEVGAPEIALAATQGYGSLPVYRRPKVVVLSTGTELVEPGTRDLDPGEIFDSNSYAIVAAAREAGAEARRLYAASDDADLGVEQVFWGVKFKPGKPLFYGTRGETRLFGLPGNPVSAVVCFDLFVRPALMGMMGRGDKSRPRVPVYFERDIVNKFGRLHAMRVSMKKTEKGWLAESVGAQGSGLVSSLTRADALALVGPASEGIPAGEPVEAIVLRQEKLLS
jgi:molybdopterin biosynthesis enzyme